MAQERKALRVMLARSEQRCSRLEFNLSLILLSCLKTGVTVVRGDQRFDRLRDELQRLESQNDSLASEVAFGAGC